MLRKNQKRRDWANDEKNLTDLGERHLTDDNSFLRQTSKGIWEYLRENKKSQVRSWEKTCGLGPTQKNTVEKI